MKILKTSDCITNEIIQCEGIQIFNYVCGLQTKKLCEAIASVICDGNTYIIKMSKEERENLPYLSSMKVSREAHINSLVTCEECKHLELMNSPFAYAHCHKWGYDFEPWGEDTRTNFCSWGERRTDERINE